MLTDIEIVKQSKMNKITEVIKKYDINEDELFLYGKYMAKVDLDIFKRLENKKDGKLILVTAITPTPTGEGKSTTTIGLVDAMNKYYLEHIMEVNTSLKIGPKIKEYLKYTWNK